MRCLAPETIYAYLDGDLPEEERSAFEAHLTACGSCRTAVERRRLIAEAASALPPLPVPDGFAAAIAARLALAPARRPLWRRPLAWAAASGALVLTGAGIMVLTRTAVPDVLPAAAHALWAGGRELVGFLAKAAAYAAVAAKVAFRLATQLLEGLRALSSFIGPEARIAALAVALMMGGAGFALWRRRALMENSHEND